VREHSRFPTRLDLGWSHRALWARLALIGLIGALNGVLLATEGNIRGLRLVAVTVIITGVWLLALRRSAQFAREQRIEPILAASLGTGIGLAAVSLINFWILEAAVSQSRLLVIAGGVFVLVGSFQAVASQGLSRPRRVAVVGANPDALELIRNLHSGGNGQFECIGVVADRLNGVELEGVRILGRSADLVEIFRRERPDLLVCSNGKLRTRTVRRLLDAGVTSVRVVDSLEFHERAFHRVANRQMRSSWFASVFDLHQHNYSSLTKRVFDVTIACLALVLTLPLFLVIALLVRCSGPGPVLFRQVRSGEGGKLFEIVKFRTMIADAEAEAGRAVWARKNDPRVTQVGRILRKTRIDELPQLWNVLRSEMSIVGPRPERPEFLEVLQGEVPFWTHRHLLKPGITGWAQVHFAYADDIPSAATKLSYDLYYLKHRSLALDCLILLKTLKLVFLGRGAR
jgi:exopolysaccharide biosynthesis polyprenyl glycosylphosphotransferase